MVKLKDKSLALSTMNSSRPQIQRGNKLFLPKIEYAKLTEARSFHGENINKATAESEKSNEEFANVEKMPLLNDDNNVDSFTRFSVLPPIKDSVLDARRLSRVRRLSSGVFSSANGPSPASNHKVTNKQGGDYRLHKYAGFSGAVAQQRRDFRVADNELVQSLQVVGKHYVGDERKTRPLPGQSRRSARSPQRSFSSVTSSETFDSNCKGCQTLLTRKQAKTEGAKLSAKLESQMADSVVHTCSKRESLTGPVLRRYNSENVVLLHEARVNEQNSNNRASQNLDKAAKVTSRPERTNILTTDFLPGRRPVSRCEINVDVNEEERDESKHQKIAPPFIQIDSVRTDQSTKLQQHDNETFDFQGTPEIQILIDSLDSAKEELPKPGREVPYTSVREQRRRSALCRNNSKQVDDFLLVHNLRDLGLL